MFLIRETPSLSNILILLVCFFHIVYMLVAVVPRRSVIREKGGMGRVSLVLLGSARPPTRRAFLGVSSVSAYSNIRVGRIILKRPEWHISFGWHLLQRAARLLVPHLWLALALCSCPAHEGWGSVFLTPEQSHSIEIKAEKALGPF